MTPEEQQQVNARSHAYEQTILNIAHQDADKAVIIEQLAQALKAAQEKIKEMTPKTEPTLAVVPTGDAA